MSLNLNSIIYLHIQSTFLQHKQSHIYQGEYLEQNFLSDVQLFLVTRAIQHLIMF